MVLAFRNIDASPGDPVQTWPFEGVLAALERGGLSDWRRLIDAVKEDPWGRVSRYVEQAVAVAHPFGVSQVMLDAVRSARRRAHSREREQVAAQVREFIAATGSTRAQFAADIGTSPSRLSTYASGSVAPSSTMLVRMQHIASRTPALHDPTH
jgi:hypothetical protein